MGTNRLSISQRQAVIKLIEKKDGDKRYKKTGDQVHWQIDTNWFLCYKNPNNPSCIDHILTNSPMSFFKTEPVFTGLPAFHKLVLSVFKLHFSKKKAKEISYRNFRDFK